MNQTSTFSNKTIPLTPVNTKVLLSLYILLATLVIIIITNSLTIVVIAKSPSLRTFTNAFLVSMSASDELYALFIFGTIVTAIIYLSHRFYYNPFLGDAIVKFAWGTLIYSCNGNLILVSLERWLYITQPFLYQRFVSVRYVAVGIAVIWVFALAINIPCVFPAFATNCPSYYIALHGFVYPIIHTFCSMLLIVIYVHISLITLQQVKKISKIQPHYSSLNTDNSTQVSTISKPSIQVNRSTDVHPISQPSLYVNTLVFQIAKPLYSSSPTLVPQTSRRSPDVDSSTQVSQTSKPLFHADSSTHVSRISSPSLYIDSYTQVPQMSSPAPDIESCTHIPRISQPSFNADSSTQLPRISQPSFNVGSSTQVPRISSPSLHAENWKAIKLLITICGLFFIFVSPYVYLSSYMLVNPNKAKELELWYNILFIFQSIYHCSNFFVYVLRIRKFRQVLKRDFKKCVCCH